MPKDYRDHWIIKFPAIILNWLSAFGAIIALLAPWRQGLMGAISATLGVALVILLAYELVQKLVRTLRKSN